MATRDHNDNPFPGRDCIQDIECPRCHGKNARKSTGFGGPAIYRRLVCNLCGFKGGNSRDYEGEEERVEREIRERFVLGKRRDAVHEFVDSVIGTTPSSLKARTAGWRKREPQPHQHPAVPARQDLHGLRRLPA